VLCIDRPRQSLFAVTSLSPIEAFPVFSLARYGNTTTSFHSFFLVPGQALAVAVTDDGTIFVADVSPAVHGVKEPPASRIVGECVLRSRVTAAIATASSATVSLSSSSSSSSSSSTFSLLLGTLDEETKIGEAVLLDVDFGTPISTPHLAAGRQRSRSASNRSQSQDGNRAGSVSVRFSARNLFRIRGSIAAFAVRCRLGNVQISDATGRDSGKREARLVRDVLSVSSTGNVDVWCVEEGADRTVAYGSLSVDSTMHGSPAGRLAALVIPDGSEENDSASLWVGTSSGDTLVFALPSAAALLEEFSEGSKRTKAGNGSMLLSAATVVLSHHRAPVEQIALLSLGSQVWTCCKNGVVAVWDAAAKQLRGSFEMRESAPLLSPLQVGQVDVQTQLWAVDSLGSITLWKVKEGVVTMPLKRSAALVVSAEQQRSSSSSSLAPGRQRPDGAKGPYEALVEYLTSLLTAAGGGGGDEDSDSAALLLRRQEYTIPSAIEARYPDAVYLPDAIMSLTDCRMMLAQTFADIGWVQRSFNEDVFAVLNELASTRRKGARAKHVAGELARLCPAFPLPPELSDPFDRLITSAECILEEVADKGFLRDPNRPDDTVSVGGGRTPPASGRAASNSLESSVDRTPRPAASIHIYETQLATLEQQLAECQASSERRVAAKDQLILQLEGEVRELQRYADEAIARERAQQSQLEKLEMARLAARQSSERSIHDAQQRESEIERYRTELAELRVALRESNARAADAEEQLAAKDQLVRELTAYVKQQATAIEDLTERGNHVHDDMCRLRDEVLRFQQREAKGRRLLAAANASFDQTHRALREIVDEVHRYHSAAVDAAFVTQRLGEVLQAIENNFHAARTSVRGGEEVDGGKERAVAGPSALGAFNESYRSGTGDDVVDGAGTKRSQFF
jgi:hypothetical protein